MGGAGLLKRFGFHAGIGAISAAVKLTDEPETGEAALFELFVTLLDCGGDLIAFLLVMIKGKRSKKGRKK